MARKKSKASRRPAFRFNFRILFTVIFSACAVGLVGWAGYGAYTSTLFQVSPATVYANIEPTSGLRRMLIGRSIFAVDTAAVSAALRTTYPEAKAIIVRKAFPAAVFMEVRKREPFAQVRSRKYYSLDREAVVLTSGSSQALERLILVQLNGFDRELRAGVKLDDVRVEKALQLIDALRAPGLLNQFQVKEVNAFNVQSMYILVSGAHQNPSASVEDIKIIFGDSGYDQKIQRLQNLLASQLNDKLELVKYIDLRHQKVYVGFKQ